MGFNVDQPWWLLLLLLIPLYIWYMIRYTTRLVGMRKISAITIRSFIILLIICLIAGIMPYSSSDRKNIVFAVDRSASISNNDTAINVVNNAISAGDEKSYQAILSFGNGIAIDRTISPLQGLAQFRTTVAEDGTIISNALRQASGMLSQQGGGRIVLISDGIETNGDMLREAQLLRSMDIAVDVVMLASEQEQDVAISEFKVPGQLKAGEKYQLSISLESTTATSAVLYIYEDDELMNQYDVSLMQGENTFLLDQLATEPGLHQYRAVVQAASDHEPINNTAYGLSRVDGPAGVLIVEGKKGSSTNIENALASSYIGYRTIVAEELSYELAEYVQYDSIIFNNVSAVDLPQIKMDNIETAVRNYGVGFLMLGGSNSYGLGGYFDTPIERILPVDMELTGKRQLPKLGLILVIDHSGSMGGDKLELAKEAAIRTVELLRPEDTVGVIAFDDRPTWVVSPTKVSNKDEIISSISAINAAGGTSIYPALKSAYEEMLTLNSERKHIILLTDGQSGTNDNYKQLTDDMLANMMTMSSVAVGSDSDTRLLESLATDAGGRYYYTEDQSTLPAIFSRETALMTRSYIVDKTFDPIIGYAGAWSQLWKSGVPEVDAYVATSAKDLAEVSLYTHMEDPLLARWNVGAGKTVAFTTDVNGEWASSWINWTEFPKVFVEWVKWTYPQFVSSPYTIDGSHSDQLLITGHDGLSRGDLGMVVRDGESEQVYPLIPVSNGQYEVDTGALKSGVYFTQIGKLTSVDGTNTIQNGVTTGFVVPYSAEYQLNMDSTVGVESMTALAELTGGRVIELDKADELFQFAPTQVKQIIDWTKILLIIILLLWLVDIGNRRLSLPWKLWLNRGVALVKVQRKPHSMPQQAENETMSRLAKRKNSKEQWYASMNGNGQPQQSRRNNNENSNQQQVADSSENRNFTHEVSTDTHNVTKSSTAKTTRKSSGDDTVYVRDDKKHTKQSDTSTSLNKVTNSNPADQRNYVANNNQAAQNNHVDQNNKEQSRTDHMNRLLAAKNRKK
ncbi:MAG: VWA domain-containing protein [Candidatus Pristimantibacillus lignocellulolyticus]|uniref:VWA domain-containing protein n=1 Tax=Candidatus Pristimantibacillus lignocellulolyticus TaxID=2994561 RepID=A0A9J6ZBN1_9BACL|nr:MAG: VWA domain-containing protein [Candidatus Pristimantibacillus lignocellulolyticus]